MTRHVLFLCTGNYYRSRFAEQFFNARASQLRLGWIADSRGIELREENVGAVSAYAVGRLQAHGIAVDRNTRFPIQLQAEDLTWADLIIALDEVEHRPLLEKHFPALAHRVEYWQVHDLERASPDEALSMIEREIGSLIRRLVSV